MTRSGFGGSQHEQEPEPGWAKALRAEVTAPRGPSPTELAHAAQALEEQDRLARLQANVRERAAEQAARSVKG